MLSLRREDQVDRGCGEEQSFLSGVPASAAGESEWTKKDETSGAGWDVEGIVAGDSIQIEKELCDLRGCVRHKSGSWAAALQKAKTQTEACLRQAGLYH